ncbi:MULTISPECIES: hypothetical protein [unclassified Pseudomonas]|uniref:hypothetical protein n=1 Tax=unclassified Pseudomonas TaxID=196821 RepID=UPI00201079F5|nr:MULTISPECIES: hypothetical protein [unclassified Pseudomonas]
MDCDQLLDDLCRYVAAEPGSLEAAVQELFEGLARGNELVAISAHLRSCEYSALSSVIREVSARPGAFLKVQGRLKRLRVERQIQGSELSSKKTRNKDALLRELNALVAASDLPAAERLLLDTLEDGQDPDYLMLLGRVFTLQHRPVEGAKAMQTADAIRRQQRAFSLGYSSSQDDQLSEEDLEFFQVNARQFAPLEMDADEPQPVRQGEVLPLATAFIPSTEVRSTGSGAPPHRAGVPKEPKRRLSLNPSKAVEPDIKSDSEDVAQIRVVSEPSRSFTAPLNASDPTAAVSWPNDPEELDSQADAEFSPGSSRNLLTDAPVPDDFVASRDQDAFHLDQIDGIDGIDEPMMPDVESYAKYSSFDANAADDFSELALFDSEGELEGILPASGVYHDDPEDEFAIYDFDADSLLEDDDFKVEPKEAASEYQLTREERALQKAVALIVKYDWPHATRFLIQRIFVMSGWGATRLALERAIDEGLTPEELVLAAHIKVIWADNDLYWIAFDSTGNTRLSCHALSWRTALLIVRSFESIPQVEEIDVLLEQLFESWYENPTLRRVFKAFARYLWYRFGDLDAVLPPSVYWDFDSPHRWPTEESSDLGVPDDLGIQKLQKLRSYGVPHIKDPQVPGCYFSDLPIKSEAEEVARMERQDSDQPAESTTGNVECTDHTADLSLAELTPQTTFEFTVKQCSAPTLDSSIESSSQSLSVS